VFAGEVFKWWGPGVAGSDYGFVQSASLIFQLRAVQNYMVNCLLFF
jgi:hypothetical protein